MAVCVRDSEDKNIRPDEDKSNIYTDTGVSICVTGSLENTTDVVEKLVRVEMAENGSYGTSMKATHVCMKTYFLKNRSGAVVSLTVPALYVKSVNQDLLSGKACNKIGVHIILDEDPDSRHQWIIPARQRKATTPPRIHSIH